ncbi:anti-sigma factor family protein [Paludisphaera mucosa]|uniref:Putative zinc-finger domain-containing protein n=1 Tax=Paludisphaera mucosa TaxID=3030827 RepID=A0ABT6F7Z9_9BACT|nr:hypothetical protein [Paludisphaera mucosa]MDG3003705.1 hypothetical protein [Paludisphaera mucosa]
MSDDLETLISAYLDDELTPEQRREAEAAVAAEPTRADELRSLGAVHELLAALSRPAAPDMTGRVLARLAASPSPTWGDIRAFPAVPALRRAAAAAVLVAGFLGVLAVARFRGDRRPDHPISARPIVPPVAIAEPAVARDPVAVVDPIGPPTSVAGAGSGVFDPPSPTYPARLVARELLDRPGPYRVFLVSGVDDQAKDAEVASLLGLSSHRDFYRFDVPAGESPRTPRSLVYAAELDPNELSTLRSRLAAAFPGRLDEGNSAALLMSELSQLGQATTFRADPAAEVLFPQTKMALRLPAEPPQPGGPQRGEGTLAAEDPVRPGQASLVGPPEPSSVVLIWMLGAVPD